MDFKNVKDILTILLIKKNNFIIKEHEHELIDELEYLLALANSYQISKINLECQCQLDEDTIELEIKMNQCTNCGLPLTIV